MSLRAKLILLVVSVLIIVGVGLGSVIYWQNNYNLSAHTNDDITSNINFTDQLVNFYLGRVQSNLNNLAADPLMTEILTTRDPSLLVQASDKLTTISEAVDVIENIALFEVSSSSCFVRVANKKAQGLVGQDLATRDYCRGIIRTKAPYVSAAFISAVSHYPIITIVIPIPNKQGKMLGFIYGSVNLSELRGYLWDLQRDSSVVLLDRYGVPFLDTTEILQTLDSPPTAVESLVKKQLSAQKNAGDFRYQGDFIGYKFNGLFTVIYQKSAADLLAQTSQLNLIVFSSLIIAIILSILIIYFFISVITSRISRLSKISQELAGGKFDIKLDKKDLAAHDETAVLARAFNDMAKKLADLYKNLEQQVKERTDKLGRSESQLKKALAESQRTNRLMVGRELKMIELKKELYAAKEKNRNNR